MYETSNERCHDCGTPLTPEEAQINVYCASCRRKQRAAMVQEIEALGPGPGDVPHYILIAPEGRDALYDYNLVAWQGVRVALVKCPSQFLAEYQRGRINSYYHWSVGSQAVFEDAATALDAALGLEEALLALVTPSPAS